MGRSLAKIDIVGAARVRALKDITNTVLKASKWIWLKRSEEEIKRTMEEPKELRLGDILHTIGVY